MKKGRVGGVGVENRSFVARGLESRPNKALGL